MKLIFILGTWTEKATFFCQFLNMVPLNDGRANTIVEAITIKAIPIDQIFGLGTDGAAVMTAKN